MRKLLFILLSLWAHTSCSSLGYLWHVSKGQMDLLDRKVPIEEALSKYEFTEEERKKLEMVSEVKSFARDKLKMDIDEDIYSSYVQLEENYVTYILRVAYEYELKAYTWSFPIVGSVPYKGFFEKEKALLEAKKFPEDKYDTLVRGVSAYSTLDWFEDPILSSMLSYSERNFVKVLFHELAHTVLFFKSQVDFNERFAEFLGRKATILFYLEKEGENSPTVQKIQEEWQDELLFSSFMVTEFESLDEWYKVNVGNISQEQKKQRLKDIQTRFLTKLKTQLKTNHYDYFANLELNNARLLSYRSYNYNMEEFEKLFSSSVINESISAFIEYCSQFEKADDPESALKSALADIQEE